MEFAFFSPNFKFNFKRIEEKGRSLEEEDEEWLHRQNNVNISKILPTPTTTPYNLGGTKINIFYSEFLSKRK